MPYSAEISRANPTCLLFVIDQSGSMGEAWGGASTKAQFLADVLNKSLMELVIRCRKAEGVLNYFDVGAISYSGSGVGPAFGGKLANAHLCEIASLAAQPVRVESRKKRVPDGAGGLVDTEAKFPVWFDAQASGGTPMCEALRLAGDFVSDWCQSHQNSFPPTVMHVTDGEATDGSEAEVESAARYIMQQSTLDGSALLLNLHVSAQEGKSIRFPAREEGLPNSYAKSLFRASSVLPPELLNRISSVGLEVANGSRGYIFNGQLDDVVTFFEIGTKPRLLAGDR